MALGTAITSGNQTYDTEQQVDDKIKMLKQFEDKIQNMGMITGFAIMTLLAIYEEEIMNI